PAYPGLRDHELQVMIDTRRALHIHDHAAVTTLILRAAGRRPIQLSRVGPGEERPHRRRWDGRRPAGLYWVASGTGSRSAAWPCYALIILFVRVALPVRIARISAVVTPNTQIVAKRAASRPPGPGAMGSEVLAPPPAYGGGMPFSRS